MQQMMERGWLGEKRGQGFYKRVGKGAEKEIWALDRKTLEYHPAQKARFPAVEAVRGIEDLGAAAARAGGWRGSRRAVSLAAVPRLPDLLGADGAGDFRPHRGDRSRHALGLRVRQLGPFELWDALGVPETVERMRREGCAVPENVERMLAGGRAVVLRSGGSRRRAAARATSI